METKTSNYEKVMNDFCKELKECDDEQVFRDLFENEYEFDDESILNKGTEEEITVYMITMLDDIVEQYSRILRTIKGE